MMSNFIGYLHEKYGEDFFRQEIRNDYLVTDEKKEIWAVLLDLYEKFAKVCEKHGLKYGLIGGSLLGAVRHGGFIPWDDDFDVAMPRADYEKLIALGNEFEYPYFLQTPYSDEGYAGSYAKIRNSETTFLSQNWIKCGKNINMGILLDVFPLDYIPFKEVASMRESIFPMIMQCSAYMKHGAIMLSEKDVLDVKKYFNQSLTNVQLYENVQRCARKYENNECSDSLSIIVATVYDESQLVWAKEWFDDMVSVKYENIIVKIPKGYDKILTTNYGNYMEFPPADQRGKWHEKALIMPRTPYSEAIKEWLNVRGGVR